MSIVMRHGFGTIAAPISLRGRQDFSLNRPRIRSFVGVCHAPRLLDTHVGSLALETASGGGDPPQLAIWCSTLQWGNLHRFPLFFVAGTDKFVMPLEFLRVAPNTNAWFQNARAVPISFLQRLLTLENNEPDTKL